MGWKDYRARSQESVMFDFVKIFPNSILVESAPTNSGALEVPPEVSVGHYPSENQGAARDRTCQLGRPRINMS